MKRFALAALALLAACANTTTNARTATPPEKPSPGQPVIREPRRPDAKYDKAAAGEVAALVASNNAFAMDLYAAVKDGQGDFAMSPASIALALGMTYAGAEGETEKQMKSALHFSLDEARVHRAYGTLLRAWNAPDKRPYRLSVANRLFGEQTLPFDKAFLSVTAEDYAAELQPMNFKTAAESARIDINGWIETKTEKRIKNILPEGSLTSDSKLVLANAIYFKGKWAVEFEKSNTRDEDFHAPGGSIKASMMHLKSGFRHAATDGVQLLEMPYQGKELSMTIILPEAVDGLPALEKKLTHKSLERWRAGMSEVEVDVALPRFKIDPPQPFELTKVLGALGIRDAFDPEKANFGGMSPKADELNLHITSAFHKAFVEVNEEGTEAAAATAVVIGAETTSVEPEPIRFRADHPFLFVLRDKQGTILFIGRVSRPTA
jgi:serine protease inhibitor